ncbi:hypothetical protein [Salinimicrobium sp. GXAS 041]|uniref:hypothetical protein n=1 Tax=Salinimicrobium sp. GXAS 041 TaxID=3400806 RepID=UPI003C774A86
MKTLGVLLFFLVLSAGSCAQALQVDGRDIENAALIGVSSKLHGSAKLYSVQRESQKLFILTFYNPDAPNMYEAENISFYGTNQDLDMLYEFLKKGFSSRERRLKNLGEGHKMAVSFAYSSILVEVLRENGLNGWFFLSKKQLDRLFGKV